MMSIHLKISDAELSENKLTTIRPMAQAYIDQGQIAGLVTLVGRKD
ncbi:MAG: hypothetical protein AAF629_21365 [Chloroflexota bacterium]